MVTSVTLAPSAMMSPSFHSDCGGSLGPLFSRGWPAKLCNSYNGKHAPHRSTSLLPACVCPVCLSPPDRAAARGASRGLALVALLAGCCFPGAQGGRGLRVCISEGIPNRRTVVFGRRPVVFGRRPVVFGRSRPSRTRLPTPSCCQLIVRHVRVGLALQKLVEREQQPRPLWMICFL